MPEPSVEPPQEPHPQWVGVTQPDCQKMLQHALTRDPTVKFMVDKMKEVQSLLMQGNIASLLSVRCNTWSFSAAQKEPAELHL